MHKKIQFNVIEINWQRQNIKVDDAFDLTSALKKVNGKNVLYQIYGNSPIYGNTLLYIGITKDSNRRFNQHLKGLFSRGLDLDFIIGSIDVENDDHLEICESILINLHKPSYNSEYINDIYFKAKEERYMILNKGNRGLLSLECSNVWWPIFKSDSENSD